MSTQDSEEVDPHANADAAWSKPTSNMEELTPSRDVSPPKHIGGVKYEDFTQERGSSQVWAPTDAPIGAKGVMKKIPGSLKWRDVVLKRGITTEVKSNSQSLWKWRKTRPAAGEQSVWVPTDAPVGAGDAARAEVQNAHYRARYQIRLGEATNLLKRGAAISLLALLLGGGVYVAVRSRAFGACQSSARQTVMTVSLLASALEPCGSSGVESGGTGSLVSATGTAALATPTALVTATTPAQPSATVAPRPTAKPTVQPTVTATPVPRPVVSILAPANNSIATNTNGESPSSDPITFHASATPGQGARSVTITWLDSVDGVLGTGATLVHTLSSQHPTNCGASTPHVVTAKAQNNLGGVASTSITVSVVPNCLA